MKFKQLAIATAVAAICASSSAHADTIATYDWTGVFTMITPEGDVMANTSASANDVGGYQTYLSGEMSFNFDTGAGTATVDSFLFNGSTAQAHDVNMQAIGDGNMGPGTLVAGNLLFDWAGNNNISIDNVLDAGGFFTGDQGFNPDMSIKGDVAAGPAAVAPAYEPICAFALGTNCFVELNNGPVLMATVDGNPYVNEDVTIYGVDGVTVAFEGNRHTDGLSGIAMDNGPFPAFNANFDIRTMTLTDVEVSAVPVPAAVWLFGSGLLGLVGIARRKKQA